MFRTFLALGALCGLAVLPSPNALSAPSAGAERLYIGTYTWYSSRGIYRSGLDLGTGALSPTNLAGTATSPSFLALHPNRKFLYAVNEDGAKVVAFSVNPATGNLTFLNQQDSNGASPCHVAFDQTANYVLVANYTGGSVTVFPIQADGRLGAATSHVQHAGTSPHAHHVALAAANRFALVCDLGLDKIMSYRFDAASGTLTPNTTPWTAVATGSGPRHLAFDPSGRRAYVICELASTIIGFDYDATNGTLSSFQTISTLPAVYTGQKWAAEIAFHPSGKFLYGSNRGYNSIAVFAVDPATGRLTPLQQQPTGQTPRHFAIDPSGAYCLVADQDSDDIRLYTIDAQTGLLAATAQKLTVSRPVCVIPCLTQPPQPVLQLQGTVSNTVNLLVGNSLPGLAYELHQAGALGPLPAWTPLATGTPGQTNFLITNSAPQAFIRAAVVTNY